MGNDHFVAVVGVCLNSDGQKAPWLRSKSGLKILPDIPLFMDPLFGLFLPGFQDEDLAEFFCGMIEDMPWGKATGPEVFNSPSRGVSAFHDFRASISSEDDRHPGCRIKSVFFRL